MHQSFVCPALLGPGIPGKYKPKGVQPGGFVGQLVCSLTGADPDIIVLGGGEEEVQA